MALIRGSMSSTERRRNASSTMLRKRVWSGSSVVSMLLASAAIEAGIHQRSPATAPPSWRSEKTAVSFRTRAVASWVVVTQTGPTIGNLVAMTGPDARSDAIVALGSRRNASLLKSTRGTIGRSPLHATPRHEMGLGSADASPANASPDDGCRVFAGDFSTVFMHRTGEQRRLCLPSHGPAATLPGSHIA